MFIHLLCYGLIIWQSLSCNCLESLHLFLCYVIVLIATLWSDVHLNMNTTACVQSWLCQCLACSSITQTYINQTVWYHILEDQSKWLNFRTFGDFGESTCTVHLVKVYVKADIICYLK
jgi:hypothetical protein